MNDLISELTGKLGIDDATAKAVSGKAMAMLRENVGDDLFAKISDAVPNAKEMAEQPAGEQAEGGGLLGSLAGMASQALGGKAGSGIELSSELVNAGLPLEKLGPFVTTLLGFLKQYLGEDVIEQILGKVPMLKDLLEDR